MLITCQICGKERIETIDALGHDVSTEWIIDKEPTCTESGSKSHHCSRCDLTTDVTVIDAIGHSWDKGEITTPATCTETGIRTFTCSACQETRTEIIDEIGHDFGNWTEVDENQHQRICKNDSSHVEKENHSWNDGVVTQAASCTEAGIRTYTCSVCGATKTSTINAFSHEYGSWTKFDDNQHQRICENDSSHVEKENHSWNGGTVTKATTCTEMGIRT